MTVRILYKVQYSEFPNYSFTCLKCYYRLQELHESYQNVTNLKKKIKSVIETLKKSKKLTPDIEKSLLDARNLSEVDLVVSGYKHKLITIRYKLPRCPTCV